MTSLDQANYSHVSTEHPDFQEPTVLSIKGANAPKIREQKPKLQPNLNLEERRYFAVKEIPQIPKFSWLTESALRHLIDRSRTIHGSKGFEIKGNGFATCVIRVGGKILIDAWELDKWVESHRMSA